MTIWRAVEDTSYFLLGLPFLVISFVKNRALGYTTPTGYDSADAEKAGEYANHIYEVWKTHLGSDFVAGKRVLELCPGNSLGIGARVIGDGAESYLAVDAFSLVRPANTDAAIAASGMSVETEARVRSTMQDPSLFDYKVDREFDIPRMVDGRKFDVIFSCASFEHFDNIEATIAGVSEVAAPGGVTAHIVDFQTHTKWIRDVDPNSIYRYPNWLYRLLGYGGQPNRRRPKEYIHSFAQNGWQRPFFSHTVTVPDKPRHLKGLQTEFRDDPDDMRILNGILIAQRPLQ